MLAAGPLDEREGGLGRVAAALIARKHRPAKLDRAGRAGVVDPWPAVKVDEADHPSFGAQHDRTDGPGIARWVVAQLVAPEAQKVALFVVRENARHDVRREALHRAAVVTDERVEQSGGDERQLEAL